MQGQLLNELLSVIDSKMFTLVLQLIIVGAVFMWIKDMNGRIVNYLKLKMSDFGRGTTIVIGGHRGIIHRVSFNEVEIVIDEDSTLFMPVEKFITSPKVIIAKRLPGVANES